MPTWIAASVKDQPDIELADWSIKGTNKGEYFVGRDIREAGRVSTRIVEFDEENKVGKTASGRVYKLVGNPGYSGDGEYVWRIYKQANGLTETEDD
jgi:hypothetical protein